jgi:hypothetical protein
MTINLLEPLMMGDLSLPNRIVMAPLTRNRALHEGDLPHELMALYYAQRASAGLIISEGVQISPEGKGYAWTPGIYSPEQVNGWRTRQRNPSMIMADVFLHKYGMLAECRTPPCNPITKRPLRHRPSLRKHMSLTVKDLCRHQGRHDHGRLALRVRQPLTCSGL